MLINLPDAPDKADPFHGAALATYDALVDSGLDVDTLGEIGGGIHCATQQMPA